uniref:40S ribosomal protein S15 n=1 Tax=Gongylonema pulchrum TaxID=637853 RepID=A0A183ES38_9BILA
LVYIQSLRLKQLLFHSLIRKRDHKLSRRRGQQKDRSRCQK